jgi:hypothetical protein
LQEDLTIENLDKFIIEVEKIEGIKIPREEFRKGLIKKDMLLKQKLFSGDKFSKNDELLKIEKYFEFYIRKKHQLDEMVNFEEMNSYLSKHFMIIIK